MLSRPSPSQPIRGLAILTLIALAATPKIAIGQGSSGGVEFPTADVPAAVGGYGSNFRYGFDTMGRPVVIASPLVFPLGPAPTPPAITQAPGGGLMLPSPISRPVALRPAGVGTAPHNDPARGRELVAVGDRLFRGGNRRRAEERYKLAARVNPRSATPHVRLAQLAFAREDYAEAAARFRLATAADPAWVVEAEDVESLFAEPTEFGRSIARLEAHLQANPRDRDACLVLGGQLLLSGKRREAGDVLARIANRRPEPSLAAFLDATAESTPAPCWQFAGTPNQSSRVFT